VNTSNLRAGDGQRGRRRRRAHSAEFKAEAVAACSHRGISIAAVALDRGLNANLLRRWVREAEQPGARRTDAMPAALAPVVASPSTSPTPAAPRFIALTPAQPVGSPSVPPAPPPVIFVELHRAETSIYISWPLSASAEAAAWLRDLPALLK
jgi:transposase